MLFDLSETKKKKDTDKNKGEKENVEEEEEGVARLPHTMEENVKEEIEEEKVEEVQEAPKITKSKGIVKGKA